MNKKLAVALPIVLATSSLNALPDVKPYVGLDLQWRIMNYYSGHGDNLFSHQTPQARPYLGVEITDYFGVEIGYENTLKKSRTNTLNLGSYFAGTQLIPTDPNQPITPLVFQSASTVRGPSVEIWGTYRISKRKNINLIGTVSLASLTFKGIAERTMSVGVADYKLYEFKKRKLIPTIGIGLDQTISEDWGVVAMVKHQLTSKIRAYRVGTNPNSQYIRPKNSVIISLGTYVYF